MVLDLCLLLPEKEMQHPSRLTVWRYHVSNPSFERGGKVNKSSTFAMRVLRVVKLEPSGWASN